jgi:Rrf2 family protein
MSIIFSRQCEYALQAVIYLALGPAGGFISIKDLTEKLDIPYHFLAKILQSLAGKGILASQKGPSGGFSLARPANEITLYQIVEAVDGPAMMHNCVMGFPECNGTSPCAVHASWAGLREDIHSMLSSKKIDKLALEMNKPGYRKKRT